MLKICALMIVFTLVGCASTKGYKGAALKRDEVARIYAAKPLKLKDSKLTIVPSSVDGKVVGNRSRGYPPFVDVLPGNRKLGVFYHRFKLGNAIATGVVAGLGGAIGGAILASSAPPKGDIEYIYIEVEAEAGKEYILLPDSKDGTSKNVDIYVEPYQDEEAYKRKYSKP